MTGHRKLLKKGEFVYGIVATWVVLGLLVGVLCFMPTEIGLENSMARFAYGLMCVVTVFAGFFAWYQLKRYVDVMYDKYVANKKEKWEDSEKEKWGDMTGR